MRAKGEVAHDFELSPTIRKTFNSLYIASEAILVSILLAAGDVALVISLITADDDKTELGITGDTGGTGSRKHRCCVTGSRLACPLSRAKADGIDFGHKANRCGDRLHLFFTNLLNKPPYSFSTASQHLGVEYDLPLWNISSSPRFISRQPGSSVRGFVVITATRSLGVVTFRKSIV